MPEHNRRLGRGWSWLGGGAVVLVLLVLWRVPLIAGLHVVDQRWFGESIIDTLSRLRGDEDWSRMESLARPPDYRWLLATPAPVRIAHALGESARPGANTLAALQRALARGFKRFEVDLWLSGDEVRCHHGPPAPPPLKPGDCELRVLLDTLPQDAWLVLDIKTDFVSTGDRVLELAAAAERTSQLVFQLYKPQHLHQFNVWQQKHPSLPGPLVTAYAAHRAVNHVAAHAWRAGIGVLTLPIERLEAYSRRELGLKLLVHPVHDCAALQTAIEAQAHGVYQLSGLVCPQ